MVKFFICSDFQLEKFDYSTLYNTDLFPDPKDIDILFIVGDLGELKYEEHYDHFIMTLTTAYKIVMLIPGNHEYYNITIKKGNIILENMKNKYHNFYVLNNNYFILEDIIFYGSTLWSDVTSVKKLPRKVPILNDENKKINIDEWKELHNISINSLKEIIQISKELNKKLYE